MAARTPRRSFANPFVVTLAAAPACFVSSSTPPSQPISQAAPGQPEQTDPQPTPPPPQQSSPVIIANPPHPRPTPTPNPPPPDPVPVTPDPVPAPSTTWTVFKDGASCRATENIQCPPKAMCNPPPPKTYACPENVKLPAKIVVIDGGCRVDTGPMRCPPKAMCNPPPPHNVPCPK